MQEHRFRLLVGLGNPGKSYGDTRHNLGFMVLDQLADEYAIPVSKTKFDTVFGRGRIQGNDVFLVKPQAYMNRSGMPTRRLADYYGISSEDIIVVHDDIDLMFNRLKIKQKGGHGGHNGIKSLMNAFGGGDFARVRMGIGRSGDERDVADHVLGKFLPEERKSLERFVTRAREAVVTILCDGIKRGMNQFN
jgi:PTH1 family peptidyl-tRNA hydrolase